MALVPPDCPTCGHGRILWLAATDLITADCGDQRQENHEQVPSYRQCTLYKPCGEEARKVMVSHIPETFAQVGNVLKLKQEDNTWEDGWIVESVGVRIADKNCPIPARRSSSTVRQPAMCCPRLPRRPTKRVASKRLSSMEQTIDFAFAIMRWLPALTLVILFAAAFLHWRRTRHWCLLTLAIAVLLMALGDIGMQIMESLARPVKKPSGTVTLKIELMWFGCRWKRLERSLRLRAAAGNPLGDQAPRPPEARPRRSNLRRALRRVGNSEWTGEVWLRRFNSLSASPSKPRQKDRRTNKDRCSDESKRSTTNFCRRFPDRSPNTSDKIGSSSFSILKSPPIRNPTSLLPV